MSPSGSVRVRKPISGTSPRIDLTIALFARRRVVISIELAELGEQDRAGQLGHPEVHPEERARRVLRLEPVGRMALVVHREAALVEVLVVGHEQAAVAAGDRLELVEAERPDLADPADAPALVARAGGLGAVLDEWDPVLVGDRLELGEPSRRAEHVDDEDRRGPRGDLRLDVSGVQVERVVDLGQDRRGAGVHDRRDRRHIREARDDHLVARADAEPEQGDPQGRRAAAAQAERVADPGEPGHLLLDVVDLRREVRIVGRAVPAQVAAVEHLEDLGDLLRADELDPGAWHGLSLAGRSGSGRALARTG